MIKKCLIAMMASAVIGCAPQPENESANKADSTNTVQESGPGCAELQEQIEHLNDEIATLKKELRKNSETSSSHKKSSAQKTESSSSAKSANTNTPVKEPAPVIKDQDKNASVRCSATDKSVRCKKRTFSPNGLCWQHGGN